MNLTRVTSTKTKTKKDGLYYTGYKVVKLSKTGKTFSTFFNKHRPFLKWLNRIKTDKPFFSSLYNLNKPFLKWLKSGLNRLHMDITVDEIKAKDGKLYKNGFHIWTSKKAAQRYKRYGEIICQVLFTKIIAEGVEDIYNLNKHEIEHGYRCVVTDKIFVLPPSKSK